MWKGTMKYQIDKGRDSIKDLVIGRFIKVNGAKTIILLYGFAIVSD